MPFQCQKRMTLKVLVDGQKVLLIIIFSFEFLFQVFDEPFRNLFISLDYKTVDCPFIVFIDVQLYDGKAVLLTFVFGFDPAERISVINIAFVDAFLGRV